MQGKISIADRVALAVAFEHTRAPGFLKPMRFTALREGSVKPQAVNEKDGRIISRQRMLMRAGWKRTLRTTLNATAVALAAGLWVYQYFNSAHALDIFRWAFPFLALLVILHMSLSARKPLEDRRIVAIRFLRQRPVKHLLTARSDITALNELLRKRDDYRNLPKAAKRAWDIYVFHAPATTRYNFLLLGFALLFLVQTLYKPALPFGLSIPPKLMIFVFLGLTMYNFNRRTLAGKLDAAQKSGHCPDCSFDLRGAPRHPALAHETLAFDIGPPRCPECGVDWPLLPPPTLEEILTYKPGASGSLPA